MLTVLRKLGCGSSTENKLQSSVFELFERLDVTGCPPFPSLHPDQYQIEEMFLPAWRYFHSPYDDKAKSTFISQRSQKFIRWTNILDKAIEAVILSSHCIDCYEQVWHCSMVSKSSQAGVSHIKNERLLISCLIYFSVTSSVMLYVYHTKTGLLLLRPRVSEALLMPLLTVS